MPRRHRSVVARRGLELRRHVPLLFRATRGRVSKYYYCSANNPLSLWFKCVANSHLHSSSRTWSSTTSPVRLFSFITTHTQFASTRFGSNTRQRFRRHTAPASLRI